MTKTTIRTVKQLVDAFGGRSKFAEFLKVVPTAVSNMVSDQHIPRGYHLEIYLEAEKRGLEIDKREVFGMGKPPAVPLARRRAEARA